MDGELFASQDTILWVGNEFEPECRCGGVIAAAFGEQGKLASRAWAELGGKAEVERLRTSDMSAIGIAAPLEETRQAEEIQAVDSVAISVLRRDECVDLAKQGGQAAQIHLVVANDAHDRIAGSAAKIVEVVLRNECGSDVTFAVPAEARRIENTPSSGENQLRTAGQRQLEGNATGSTLAPKKT